MDELINSSDYNNRLNDIQQFNQANRWKKRGISLTYLYLNIIFLNINNHDFNLRPIKWGVGWSGACYNVIVSIYAIDGAVSLFHGGNFRNIN